MAPLAQAIDQAGSAQDMQKSATDAGIAVDKLLSDTAAARGVLRGKVVAAKELLVRPGALQPSLRQLIERAQADFDAVSAAIDDGDLATQEAKFSARLGRLQQDLHAYLLQLGGTAGLAIDRVGTWKSADADIASANELRAQADQMAAVTPPGDLLSKAIALWTAVDSLLSRTLRTAATRAGMAVAQMLKPSASPPIGTVLDSAHAQLVQFDLDGRTDLIYAQLAAQIGG